jgi:hypothetical protein
VKTVHVLDCEATGISTERERDWYQWGQRNTRTKKEEYKSGRNGNTVKIMKGHK